MTVTGLSAGTVVGSKTQYNEACHTSAVRRSAPISDTTVDANTSPDCRSIVSRSGTEKDSLYPDCAYAGNIPNRVDVEWLKRGGGLVGHDHPPAERFNGGQKMVYWIVVLGGGAVAVSGYVLIFPFYGTTVETMQEAEMAHAIVAMLFIAAMLAHIYIGTLGMEGAFEAMGTGTVDLNWAKEHHALWLEEQNRQGAAETRAQPSATPGD